MDTFDIEHEDAHAPIGDDEMSRDFYEELERVDLLLKELRRHCGDFMESASHLELTINSVGLIFR